MRVTASPCKLFRGVSKQCLSPNRLNRRTGRLVWCMNEGCCRIAVEFVRRCSPRLLLAGERMKRWVLSFLMFPSLTAFAEAPGVDTPELDPLTGFKMTGDWQLVRNNCVGCHSAKLVTRQRGDAEQWLAMLRWMQEKQGLWQFDADTERRIVAYLAENYPPDAQHRRAPIPGELMPPNPYPGNKTD